MVDRHEAHLRGEVVLRALSSVQPNGWNPNVVSPEKMASIEHGFRTDGWLLSQALLVWGTDDAGARRDLIIDGEHRWKAGGTVGLAQGPMVFLDGLPEVEAKALTVKMNQRRGEWDSEGLAALLRDIQVDLPDAGALDFGFPQAELDALLAYGVEGGSPGESPGTGPSGAGAVPPEDFQDLGAEGAVKTDHKCPRCSYAWSGAAK